ncbi:MAG TPA: hypothetical protein VIQ23_05465 [Hanamia sp.]
MKKIASLFFIVLFLFNVVGYRFVIDFMQHKVNAQLEEGLDNNLYNESELVELKVPLNLPYQTSWAAFQRCDGEIQIDGILYKYVKQKVANDTLYLMCIPNTKKMHLETARNDLFAKANGIAQHDNSQKSDKAAGPQNPQSVYDDFSFVYNFLIPDENTRNFLPALDSPHLLSSPHMSPEQPPDFMEA